MSRIKPSSGDEIPRSWQALHRWVVGAGQRLGRHQWLEEHLAPLGVPWDELEIDLYHPLAE